MDDALLREFLSGYDESGFPRDFLDEYDTLECLAHNETTQTLLVRARHSGEYYVCKCYAVDALLSRTSEGELLRKLHHDRIPAFAGEYKSEQMLCVVREYLPGTPLDRYVAENKLTVAQVLSIAVQLCDILTYLHTQTPPVIHRDIKPQNIIVDESGTVRLIDFGISRVFDEAAKEDTVCLGTKRFAAPEQYGFSQTDCRADLFSLGVLLGWLLTGEADGKEAAARVDDARLSRIIRRCTAFSPENRYPCAQRVKSALLAVLARGKSGQRAAPRRRALRMAVFAFICAVFLCAGFALGRYTDVSPAFGHSQGVSFEEPLIEKAVRLSLGKKDNEPLSREDLQNVSALYLYGEEALGSEQAYEACNDRMAFSNGAMRSGGLRSLRDIRKLENLRVLRVAHEDVSDLSPLAALKDLEILDVRHNPVEDASPLAALRSLRTVCLYNTHVSSLPSFSASPFLEDLNVGRTQITSLSALKGLSSLKRLNLMQASVGSLFGIEAFPLLEEFEVGDVADRDLTPLLALPRLQVCTLGEALRPYAERDLQSASFSIKYR